MFVAKIIANAGEETLLGQISQVDFRTRVERVKIVSKHDAGKLQPCPIPLGIVGLFAELFEQRFLFFFFYKLKDEISKYSK